MTVRKDFLLVINAVLVAASQSSYAAEEPRHHCAGVHGDAERLACYDQAFGKPADTVAPEKQFGLTEQVAKPTTPASLTAAVTSLDRLRDGKFVVTLDNSQVWSQSEINSQADVQVGDAVTVRRGLLGSYLLVTKAGIATRVKRVR